MELNTGQKGHWYKCRGKVCNLNIPLPDRIFIETDYQGAFMAECKCNHMNVFQWSDAEKATKKKDVDKYFDIESDRPKVISYWEK